MPVLPSVPVREDKETDTRPGQGTGMNNKAMYFIEHLSVSRNQKFNDYSILTHAWHESGAFKHVIGQNNYWGIKASDNWGGRVHVLNTHEYEPVKNNETQSEALLRIIKKYGIDNVEIVNKEGKYWYIALPQYFRDWDTIVDALNWYMGLILRLYPDSYKNRDNPIKYFEGLVSGKYKYATDISYVPKLKELYTSLLKKDDIKKLLAST